MIIISSEKRLFRGALRVYILSYFVLLVYCLLAGGAIRRGGAQAVVPHLFQLAVVFRPPSL